jgi:hypothetical protein
MISHVYTVYLGIFRLLDASALLRSPNCES